MRKSKQKLENIRGWAVYDSEVGVVGVFETREEARENKRYAKQYGHNQVVVRLTFDSVVR